MLVDHEMDGFVLDRSHGGISVLTALSHCV